MRPKLSLVPHRCLLNARQTDYLIAMDLYRDCGLTLSVLLLMPAMALAADLEVASNKTNATWFEWELDDEFDAGNDTALNETMWLIIHQKELEEEEEEAKEASSDRLQANINTLKYMPWH